MSNADRFAALLEQLVNSQGEIHPGWNDEYLRAEDVRAIARALLRELRESKPVAWREPVTGDLVDDITKQTQEWASVYTQPLYLHPSPAPSCPEGWQPIETAPMNVLALFWVVPLSEDETFTDTSGKPILSSGEPRIRMEKYGGWSSLSKATHWMPLPAAPSAQGEDK